jgi:hypothetical protein
VADPSTNRRYGRDDRKGIIRNPIWAGPTNPTLQSPPASVLRRPVLAVAFVSMMRTLWLF